MDDATIIQATLLALTKQNVTGTGFDDGSSGIIDDCVVLVTGFIESYPPIYGEYGT